jgi:hypothetical protein
MRLGHEFLGRSNTKISIVGNLGGSAARPFAQVSFSVRLQAPGEAAQQELLVVRGFRFLAEQLQVSPSEGRNLHLL